jgi:hypothetical protein
MPRSIECHYTGCRKIFKPQGNQRYHSTECARKGRRLKDRLRKRRQRSRKRQLKIEQAAQSEKQPAVPVRSSPDRRNFFIAATHVTSRSSIPPGSFMPTAAENAV